MQSVKKRIISLCMSAAIASSALTGLTVMSNADDFDSPSDIPTTRPPATTIQLGKRSPLSRKISYKSEFVIYCK